jgi:hypothetical protein
MVYTMSHPHLLVAADIPVFCLEANSAAATNSAVLTQ